MGQTLPQIIYQVRAEYEGTLMAQRKMFDEELSELGEQHEKQTEKLKRVTAEEKQKLEVQLEQAVVGKFQDMY